MSITKGFTTGVFDMFHVGHLRLLERAKSRCDRLTVGVSSDKLVLSYKNKLPIISLEDRMEIVAGLRCVDCVVPIETRDKKAQFHEHRYHKLFVGDDWKGNDIFTELEAYLAQYNSSVEYLTYTQKISSSKLNKVLQDIYDSEFSS